ncbi:hypothetical protein LSAT2_009405, partial [Lamellibrachia satsuma]
NEPANENVRRGHRKRKFTEKDFQQIEAIYEGLKNTSAAVPGQNVRLGIDRLKAEKDLLVAATLLRMTNDNISQHSSNTSVQELAYIVPEIETVWVNRHFIESKGS